MLILDQKILIWKKNKCLEQNARTIKCLSSFKKRSSVNSLYFKNNEIETLNAETYFNKNNEISEF